MRSIYDEVKDWGKAEAYRQVAVEQVDIRWIEIYNQKINDTWQACITVDFYLI